MGERRIEFRSAVDLVKCAAYCLRFELRKFHLQFEYLPGSLESLGCLGCFTKLRMTPVFTTEAHDCQCIRGSLGKLNKIQIQQE